MSYKRIQDGVKDEPPPARGSKDAYRHALTHDDMAGIRLALDAGQDPTWGLRLCSSPEAARMLLEAGADPRGDDAVISLAQFGHAGALACVIAAGADLDAARHHTLTTALMMAASHGQVKTLDALLKAGAKVGVRDLTGATALHFAASNHSEGSRRTIVVKLLRAGADIMAHDNGNETPLDVARRMHHDDVLDVLELPA